MHKKKKSDKDVFIKKKLHYPIMDKPYKELLLEELEDETVPLVEVTSRTFYKAKGELCAYIIGAYQNARFTKRIKITLLNK